MEKGEKYLSGFKMFLLSLIPMAVLAILIMAIPYGITHGTLYVTFPVFVGVISFIMLLRSKYFWLFRDNKIFDKTATVFIWIIFVTIMPILAIATLLIVLIYKKTIYTLLWVLSIITVFIFGIKIRIYGEIPDEQFILIYNHRSNVDDVINPIIMGRKPWKVVFAKGLARIPFVGNFLEYIGIPITRGEMKSHTKVTKQAISFLKEKRGNILIFPEGRRLPVEKRGDFLLEFQPGAFYWSKECDVFIVPVVVHSTFEFQPRSGQWWFSPRTISIHYLDKTKIMEDERVEQFTNRVRELMLMKLRLLEEELKKSKTVLYL